MTDFTLVVDNDIGGGRGSLHFLILTTTLCFVDIFVKVRRVNLLLLTGCNIYFSQNWACFKTLFILCTK